MCAYKSSFGTYVDIHFFPFSSVAAVVSYYPQNCFPKQKVSNAAYHASREAAAAALVSAFEDTIAVKVAVSAAVSAAAPTPL